MPGVASGSLACGQLSLSSPPPKCCRSGDTWKGKLLSATLSSPGRWEGETGELCGRVARQRPSLREVARGPMCRLTPTPQPEEAGGLTDLQCPTGPGCPHGARGQGRGRRARVWARVWARAGSLGAAAQPRVKAPHSRCPPTLPPDASPFSEGAQIPHAGTGMGGIRSWCHPGCQLRPPSACSPPSSPGRPWKLQWAWRGRPSCRGKAGVEDASRHVPSTPSPRGSWRHRRWASPA